MKIRPVGAELFHTDGLTDMTKLIVAFRNFENAPKSSGLYRTCLRQVQNVNSLTVHSTQTALPNAQQNSPYKSLRSAVRERKAVGHVSTVKTVQPFLANRAWCRSSIYRIDATFGSQIFSFP